MGTYHANTSFARTPTGLASGQVRERWFRCDGPDPEQSRHGSSTRLMYALSAEPIERCSPSNAGVTRQPLEVACELTWGKMQYLLSVPGQFRELTQLLGHQQALLHERCVFEHGKARVDT